MPNGSAFTLFAIHTDICNNLMACGVSDVAYDISYLFIRRYGMRAGIETPRTHTGIIEYVIFKNPVFIICNVFFISLTANGTIPIVVPDGVVLRFTVLFIFRTWSYLKF